MSEKHLTELAWKTLLTKYKIKETKLTKALADFGKCEEKDADARIKALAAVDKEAELLKKEHKANKELETYLVEMLKEVEKSQKAAELLKKAPKEKPPAKDKGAEENKGAKDKEKEEKGKEGKEKESEEGAGKKPKAEEEEDPVVNLKGALTGAMGRVKARKPADPPMGAMICQVGKEFGVLLSPNAGSAQQNILKGLMKGASHKFAKGTCEWSKGDLYTIVLQSPLSGAAAGVKAFLLKHTGVTYKIRVGVPGAMEEDLTESKVGESGNEGKKTSEAPGAKKAPDEVKPQGETPTKPTTNPTLTSYVKAKKEWKAAKAAAEKNIASLKAAILQQCDPEIEGLVKAKIDVWDGILSVVDDSFLIPLIDEAIKETEPERQTQHNQKLAGSVTKLASALQQHPLAAVADANPFGKFYISGPLNLMLNRLGETFVA